MQRMAIKARTPQQSQPRSQRLSSAAPSLPMDAALQALPSRLREQQGGQVAPTRSPPVQEPPGRLLGLSSRAR